MRLVNTSTLTIEEFYSNIPDYAILSHTWDGEEVTLQEFRSQQCDGKSGYKKIQEFCRLVLAQGISYAWIDTCCIDKTSSADLSEFINSMFTWYRRAQICWAYLCDISTDEYAYTNDLLRQSRWFTRGWTLQELLAPNEVVFYDKKWLQIGTKTTLRPLLQEITGVQNFTNYEEASVAQKFSWAAKRETTRVEDRAYSLFGIFGVNMPLLYGEGSRAFTRLQKEILSESDDETIFAWGPRGKYEEGTFTGLLATSPGQFIHCANIQRYIFDTARPAWSMTNHGFQFSAYTRPAIDFRTSSESLRGLVMIPLNCCQTKDGPLLTIFCQRVGNSSLSALQGYRRVLTAPRYSLNQELLSDDKERTRMTFSPSSLTWREPVERVKIYDNRIFICFDTPSLDFYGFKVSPRTHCYLIPETLNNENYRRWNIPSGNLENCRLNFHGYLNDLGLHMDQTVGFHTCEINSKAAPSFSSAWVLDLLDGSTGQMLYIYIIRSMDMKVKVHMCTVSNFYLHVKQFKQLRTYRNANKIYLSTTVTRVSSYLHASLLKVLVTASKHPPPDSNPDPSGPDHSRRR